MRSRRPSKQEKIHLEKTALSPCVVCRLFFHQLTISEVHHLDGKTKPLAHLNAIPLCFRHHRVKDNAKPPRWISRHGDGKRAFEAAYGTEAELLAEHNKNINEREF